jgi:hypothetical protein
MRTWYSGIQYFGLLAPQLKQRARHLAHQGSFLLSFLPPHLKHGSIFWLLVKLVKSFAMVLLHLVGPLEAVLPLADEFLHPRDPLVATEFDLIVQERDTPHTQRGGIHGRFKRLPLVFGFLGHFHVAGEYFIP